VVQKVYQSYALHLLAAWVQQGHRVATGTRGQPEHS
jgi:hypothetical protein